MSNLVRRFPVRLLAIFGLAMLLILLWSGHASAAQARTMITGAVTTPLPNAHYQIVNVASNLCLDDYAYSTTPGQQIQQWTCSNPSVSAQQWSLKSLGSGLYQIIVKASGLCLDDYNYTTTPGQKMQQWTCTANDSAQEWRLNSLGNGLYQLVVQASGLCLDDFNSSTAPGTLMQQYTCTANNAAQEWGFTVSGPQLWTAPSGQARPVLRLLLALSRLLSSRLMHSPLTLQTM